MKIHCITCCHLLLSGRFHSTDDARQALKWLGCQGSLDTVSVRVAVLRGPGAPRPEGSWSALSVTVRLGALVPFHREKRLFPQGCCQN